MWCVGVQWEHAYYLKHQNVRANYIKDWCALFSMLKSWDTGCLRLCNTPVHDRPADGTAKLNKCLSCTMQVLRGGLAGGQCQLPGCCKWRQELADFIFYCLIIQR